MNINHPIWNTYIDLINSDTMYFKYGLLWWCLYEHTGKKLSPLTWAESQLKHGDYEFKHRFLECKTLEQIKEELQNRLNNAFNVDLTYNPKITTEEWIDKQQNKLLIHDIIKYKKKNNHNVDKMANDIYNIFINTCKNYDKYNYYSNFDEERYMIDKNYKRSCENKDVNLELIHGSNRVLRCFIHSGLIKNIEGLNKDPKLYAMIKDYVKQTFNKDYDIKW